MSHYFFVSISGLAGHKRVKAPKRTIRHLTLVTLAQWNHRYRPQTVDIAAALHLSDYRLCLQRMMAPTTTSNRAAGRIFLFPRLLAVSP